MPTEILLVRHGQTASNVSRLYMGWSQEDLNQTGYAQVKRLAERLVEAPLAAIYSSPLKRALSTAAILAESRQLSVTPVADLVEINLGDWEGLPLEEVRLRWPEKWQGWREHPAQESIPGGESFAQVAERTIRAFRQILDQNQNLTSVVVSHEIVLKIILIHSLAADFDIYRRFMVGNASLSVLQAGVNWLRVVSINDTAHLIGLGEI